MLSEQKVVSGGFSSTTGFWQRDTRFLGVKSVKLFQNSRLENDRLEVLFSFLLTRDQKKCRF